MLCILIPLCTIETGKKKNKNREAIATHECLLSTLTASLFSTSSLCNTRLVRSLGNLHVVAGGKDPMCCEPCDSHRQTASVTTNLGSPISLSMGQVHLQASFLRSSQAKWRFGLHLHRSQKLQYAKRDVIFSACANSAKISEAWNTRRFTSVFKKRGCAIIR